MQETPNLTVKNLDEDKCMVCDEPSEIGIHGINGSMYLCNKHYHQTKRHSDVEIKLRKIYFAIKKAGEHKKELMV